jgi:hypothetical protein
LADENAACENAGGQEKREDYNAGYLKSARHLCLKEDNPKGSRYP